jgi:pimeloyl-ACP methyl ester carboxylesterase
MKKYIPISELVIIEGGGHAITVEAPEAICEAIEKFIRT